MFADNFQEEQALGYSDKETTKPQSYNINFENLNSILFISSMESMKFCTTECAESADGNISSPAVEKPQVTTTDTFMEQVETYMAFKIASFIDTYWFPVLVPVGVVGNTLSFIVMIKPNNRKMSTCIYMAAISVNDNIMMASSFHNLLVIVIKVHGWYVWQCKVASFWALFALQNSTFQVLAMTIDKYIAIKWPHRAATYSTPRRAKTIVLNLYICAIVYNSPQLYLTQVTDGQCVAYGTGGVLTMIYSWLSFVLNAVIPFTLLIYTNFVIVKAVRKSRKMFGADTCAQTDQGLEARQNTMKSAENQLTIMLLSVTMLFLILLCPTYIRFIYMAFAERDTPYQYANSLLIYQISFKLYCTNSGINFFLYCISGQKFRNDLKEILFCRDVSKRAVTRVGSESKAVCSKTCGTSSFDI